MKCVRGLLAAIGICIMMPHAASAAEPAPRVSYVALNVFNEKRSLDFYLGVLGMSERRRVQPGAAFSEILLGFTNSPDDTGVLLIVRAARDKPYDLGDGFSRFIVVVSDLNATVNHVTHAGVKLFRPITEVADPHLRYAMVKDPDGYLIEFVQHL